MKIKAILFDFYGVLEKNGQPNTEVVEFIEANNNKYLFGILSAEEGDLGIWLQDHGIADYFAIVQTTGKVGISKTDPEFYKKALTLLSIQAGQALFIDDNQGHVDIAKAVGLHAVCYNSHDNFLSTIKPYL